MKPFDHDGLLLAEYQGKLFMKSFETDCSSPVFIRRFRYSSLLKTLDHNDPSLLSLSVSEGLKDIQEEYDECGYGQNRYPPATLFWMGYLYRYISYTREEETPFIMSVFDHKLLNNVYPSFHTQDPEWCIRSLLEIKNIDASVFDKNARLKRIIRAHMSKQGN